MSQNPPCNHGNIPSRQTLMGIFCDADVCKCEQDAEKVFGGKSPRAAVEEMMKNFKIKSGI